MNGVLPAEIESLSHRTDDVLLLAASWEERCLGLARKLEGYRAQTVIVTEYDGASERRREHLAELRRLLARVGEVVVVQARHSDPLENVRRTIELVRSRVVGRVPRVSLDMTTFTRKHLLQLLHGLDSSNLLADCSMFHTESEDYDTRDDEPVSRGISDVKAIETFFGRNRPSQDSLLVLFLGYEGRRALALWEHVEPNATLAVIPEPPYRAEWLGRTQAMNQYLLSCLPEDRVLKAAAMIPAQTEQLLCKLAEGELYPISQYNYRIGPLGPKPQVLGLYRFWRRYRGQVSIMYAAPVRYREEYRGFRPGKTWLIDHSGLWN